MYEGVSVHETTFIAVATERAAYSSIRAAFILFLESATTPPTAHLECNLPSFEADHSAEMSYICFFLGRPTGEHAIWCRDFLKHTMSGCNRSFW